MTIQLASAIVGQLGPRRIAIEAPGVPTLARELALLGCDVGGADASAVVIEWSGSGPNDLASRLVAYASADALVIIPNGLSLSFMETMVFAAGWRRHPGAMNAAILGQLEAGALPEACFYQRAAHDYAGLMNAGDAASTAAIARWAMAAERARAGDRVLLCGPGASDGRTIMEALSRAGAIEVQGPGEYDARSFDLVVALDVPGAWGQSLNDITRLLKLDGRLVLGWPESSQGPGNWEMLEEALTADFLIESRFAQSAGQVVPRPVPLNEAHRPGWRIVVAAVNPIGGEAEREAYLHPAFGGSQAALVDFAADYDNPWLYRVMVQMGERLTDDGKLARLAEYVVKNARPGSADQGAALAVLGYRVLESRAAHAGPTLLGAIETYYGRGGDAPHVVRWRVSLAFLAGRLAELMGDREAAKLWYGRAAGDEWQSFSNILATKAIGAAFFVGRLLLADRDPAAWPWFQRGVDIALQAAGANHLRELGAGEGLLPFYLPELAEVIDMGSQCANALANRHLWERNPGLFWRQVDVKRFGLASWAIDMARENARLRQMMGRA